MKRLNLLLSVALALDVACGEAPTAVSAGHSGAPSFSAVVVTDNFTVPIELFVFVPCARGGAGELIEVGGPLHILVSTEISDAGTFHVTLHFQPQGVSGLGLVTGDRYQATGVTLEAFQLNGPLPLTDTFVNNFRMIGQGPDNNYLVHQTLHVTINAKGELTALQDNFSIECQ